MLDTNDYVVISSVKNGYIVSVNNDYTEDDDDRQPHVFNDITGLLEYVSNLLMKEVDEATPALQVQGALDS